MRWTVAVLIDTLCPCPCTLPSLLTPLWHLPPSSLSILRPCITAEFGKVSPRLGAPPCSAAIPLTSSKPLKLVQGCLSPSHAPPHLLHPSQHQIFAAFEKSKGVTGVKFLYEGEEVRGGFNNCGTPLPPSILFPRPLNHSLTPLATPHMPGATLPAAQINREDTPEELGIEDGAELEALMQQTGGSPMALSA